MPWRELSVMEQREEFVRLAFLEGANRSELCRRFGISRDKGYKWLGRYQASGREGLADRSRRPHRSPHRTAAATEAEVLRVRAHSNNAWGARKIGCVMERSGWQDVPALSTITEILRRHGKLEANRHEHPGPFRRFEKTEPNELWQMDFKGHFALERERCHPLTVLDDHSRYSIGLEACANEQDTTVRQRLTKIFRRYGLPLAMLMDNGSPWGDAADQTLTGFGVWLMRLDVGVRHCRPYHPQTQGKAERFHRTLKKEVIGCTELGDLAGCQHAFDRWRAIYNHERPHQAIGLVTPVTRYRPSERPFPEKLPSIEYGAADIVRKVGDTGLIRFKGQSWRIGKPFRGQPVALRPGDDDGILRVFFCRQRIGTIDLRRRLYACGFVDIASPMPTTPQAQPHQQQV